MKTTIFVFIALLSSVHAFSSGLNGTYTIDPKGGGTTNYSTFRAATKALRDSGVSGPVTFNIADGTYNESVQIDSIYGTSATNTVTFQSNSLDSSKVILDTAWCGSSSSTIIRSTFLLSSVTYVTIKKITIKNSCAGSAYYSCAIDIEGSCKYINIVNSAIMAPGDSGSNFSACIGLHCGVQGNILISQNLIRYGYEGIYSFYGKSSFQSGIEISYNVIDSSYQSGMELQYLFSVSIHHNIISNIQSKSGYGISTKNTKNDIVIEKNRIHLPFGGTGISQDSQNAKAGSSSYGAIQNNFITVSGNGGLSYGIHSQNCNKMNIVYNSINMLKNAKGIGLVTDGSLESNIYIYNNCISNTGGGYAMSILDVSSITDCNYNLLISSGKHLIYNQAKYNYDNISSWVAVSGFDKNSIHYPPGYFSDTKLYVNDGTLNAGKVLSVTDDIDGRKRDSKKPTIGAANFKVYKDDAGIGAIDSPYFRSCSGTQNVYVQLVNRGTNTLTKVEINWKVSGKPVQTYYWTGKLGLNNTIQVNVGSISLLSKAGLDSFYAWPTNPNGVPDSNSFNDMSLVMIPHGLVGVYTVDNSGKSSPDFISLREAAKVVSKDGVCGAVTFNVADGYYNESVIIGKTYGASKLNRVTFQSKSLDSSKVILDTAWSSPDVNNPSFTIRLDGSFITIREMTLRNSFAKMNYQTDVVYLNVNQSDYCIIENNRIIAPVDTTFKNTMTVDINGRGHIVRNNYIKGGFFGVYNRNHWNDSCQILQNKLDSCYRAIWFYNAINFTIKGNNIFIPYGDTGVYLSYAGLYGGANLFANNFLTMPDTNKITCGIFAGPGDSINFYSNSFCTSSRYGVTAYFYWFKGMKNNIFYNSNFGLAYYDQAYFPKKCDYNDYYTRGKVLAYVVDKKSQWVTKCANLSEIKTHTGMDVHSISSNPRFKSNILGDLHLTDLSGSLIGKGVHLYNVKNDIDLQPRSSLHPCIGADESPYPNDIGVSAILSPVDSSCGSDSTKVIVKVKNFGIDSEANNFKIGINVSGTFNDTVTKKFSGILKNGKDTILTIGFVPSLNTSIGGSCTVKAYTILCSDSNATNDSSVIKTKFLSSPNAKFYFYELPPYNGIVQFDAASKTNAKYSWTFGDSSNSDSGFSLTHNYIKRGLYFVTLNVKNSNGCETSFLDSVELVYTGIENNFLFGNISIYPNPFQNFTSITYSLNSSRNVNIDVYNMTGKYITTLQNGRQSEGVHTLRFSPLAGESGVFLLKFRIGDKLFWKELVITR